MARKVWFARLAVFLAVIVLMLSASIGNIKILNTSAQAEAEAAPYVTETVEETVQQMAEKASPPVSEDEEETAPGIESEPASVTEPEDHHKSVHTDRRARRQPAP